MFTIKNERIHNSYTNIKIIGIDCGKEIYCAKWNGEKFLDCWCYLNNDTTGNPINLGEGQYIYKINSEDEYEQFGLEVEAYGLSLNQFIDG